MVVPHRHHNTLDACHHFKLERRAAPHSAWRTCLRWDYAWLCRWPRVQIAFLMPIKYQNMRVSCWLGGRWHEVATALCSMPNHSAGNDRNQCCTGRTTIELEMQECFDAWMLHLHSILAMLIWSLMSLIKFWVQTRLLRPPVNGFGVQQNAANSWLGIHKIFIHKPIVHSIFSEFIWCQTMYEILRIGPQKKRSGNL